MVKSKSSKRLRPSKRYRCDIDRISNLPDPLISRILSLLPTKCAVATSVLSTSWKLHWISITNLDFDDLDFEGDEDGHDYMRAITLQRNKFTNFVNRVLLLLNSPSIHNFRLNCSHAFLDPSYLNSWISEAFGRTVQELDLILMLKDEMELPLSNMLYCNVAVLKLHGDNIHFNIPAAASVCFSSLQTLHLRGITLAISSNSSVSFPTLKIMHLKYVMFSNEDTVHNLFSSCPILDNLVLFRQGYDNVLCLVIRIPSLTTLKLDFYGLRYTRCKLQIDTPAIQYLHLNDDLPCEYLPTENLSSLVQAKVKLYILEEDVDRCISICKFIRSLSKVKFLSVSGSILKVIRTTSGNILPGFPNLARLKLQDHDCADLSVVINNFLETMNNLEHLVIKGWSCSCSEQSWWTEPLNVPKCLLSRVTTISTDMLNDYCDQLELLRYFLKNAEALQLMTIGTRLISEKNKLELVQKISMFRKGSRTC